MRNPGWLGVAALVAVWHCPAHAEKCLDETDKAGTSTREVALRALPSAPSFYYRADDYVAFIPQEDVREFFERTRRKDPSLSQLAKLILSDLPIRANQDLFAYVTRDWMLWNPINYSIIQLISDGKATLTNLRGVPVDRVTVLHKQNDQGRSTAVLLGATQKARVLWMYECNAG